MEHLSPETAEHLSRVEVALRHAAEQLASQAYPDDPRTVLTAGMISQAIEHHGAMLLLIRQEKVGSAFALARAIVEGMYRGLWINLAASDVEVARFERLDSIGMGITDLARAIDNAYDANQFLEDLKGRTWDALNSYAHNGMFQLGRRFTEHNL